MALNTHGLKMQGVLEATKLTIAHLPMDEPENPDKYVHIGYRVLDGRVESELVCGDGSPDFSDYILYCGKVSRVTRMQEMSEIIFSAYRKYLESGIIYDGKKVYNLKNFSYSAAKVGDYVLQDVVDDAMNILPPVSMSTSCAQIGEPYSHRFDDKIGKWRATYSTFKKVSGVSNESILQYCGNCFKGETVERGKDPVYV